MLSGFFIRRWAEHGDGGVAWFSESLPWRVRPQRLERKDANFILESILRCQLIDIRIPTKVASICDDNDLFVMSVTVDRASENLKACRFFCGFIDSVLQQPRMLFHPELCAMHGVALVKAGSFVLKQVSVALYSFTRWLRMSKITSR